MHPVRKQRLMVLLYIVFGVSIAVGLVLYALQQNINLFFTPTQIVNGEAPEGATIRAGGMVVDGSVQRSQDSLKVTFAVTDYKETVTIHYEGILPDLFREGQGIVAQGSVNANGEMQAVEVLAKHDEKYMPPEVMEALEEAGASPEMMKKHMGDKAPY